MSKKTQQEEDKKTFTQQEKEALMLDFSKPLNDQSLRIIEYFKNSGKDLNNMLLTAYKYRALC